MKKIGILSDTHGLLRKEAEAVLSGCDAILHAGDVGSGEILLKLSKIAPLICVRGNCDGDGDWAESLPAFAEAEYFGLKICMAHKKKDLPEDLSPYGLAVYGHTHRYACTGKRGTLLLNPGAAGPSGFLQPASMAVLSVSEDGERSVSRIVLSEGEQDEEERDKQALDRDAYGLVCACMAEIERGWTVARIAKAHGISEALAGQIARMILTHPGVDAEGVLRRIGR